VARTKTRQTKTRWSLRTRLTVLYGATFIISAAVLLAVSFLAAKIRVHTASFRIHISANGGHGIISTHPGTVIIAPFAPLPLQGVGLAQQLQSAAVSQRADTFHQLLIVLIIALALMAAASVALGWVVAGRALQPIRSMTTAARELSEHNLHERLPDDGPRDELGDLATTFNALLARLEAAFESQRQFVANASHELRTPLTLERAILEVTLADPAADASQLRAACERVLAIGIQQEALIEALLTLARSQRGLAQRDPLDLAVIGSQAIADARDAATARSIEVRADLAPAATTGDDRLVQRLIANLIDNAVRHNHNDGWVEVRTGTATGSPTLEVINSGPHVPPEEVGRLLRPFERLSPERGNDREGLGLGLSIVAAIAAAHDATLTAVARTEGGLHVTVAFRPPITPAG